MAWIILLTIVAVAIIIVVIGSVNVVKPNQMGIKVLLGKPGETVDSGICWVWFPFEKLERYTKKVLTFQFEVGSVMTKRGRVPGYSEVIETAEIDFHCTVQAYFDKKHLERALTHAPGKTEEDLCPELIPYVIDVVRGLGGRVPWRLINEDRRNFSLNVLHRLVPLPENGEKARQIVVEKVSKSLDFIFRYTSKEDEEKANDKKADIFYKPLTEDQLITSSPFVKFGLKDVAFIIEDINFTDDALKKAVSEPEKARLEAVAIRRKAEAENYRLQQEGEGASRAREMMIKAIEGKPDLEVLMTLREMAQGTSNTILYQLPQALDNKMRELLGGNAPADVARMLSPNDQTMIKDFIMEAIKKLAESSKGGNK